MFPKIPIITILLSLLTAGLGVSEYLSTLMQYNHSAIVSGEFWRLLTGHFTHWSADHVFWDLLLFCVLGTLFERRVCRKSFLFLIAASNLAISLVLLLSAPQISLYRGLSGLDSAFFGFLCCHFLILGIKKGDQLQRLLASGAALLFVSKTLLEVQLHTNFFVAPSSVFVPVPLAHLAGGLIGAAFTTTLHIQKTNKQYTKNRHLISIPGKSHEGAS